MTESSQWKNSIVQFFQDLQIIDRSRLKGLFLIIAQSLLYQYHQETPVRAIGEGLAASRIISFFRMILVKKLIIPALYEKKRQKSFLNKQKLQEEIQKQLQLAKEQKENEEREKQRKDSTVHSIYDSFSLTPKEARKLEKQLLVEKELARPENPIQIIAMESVRNTIHCKIRFVLFPMTAEVIELKEQEEQNNPLSATLTSRKKSTSSSKKNSAFDFKKSFQEDSRQFLFDEWSQLTPVAYRMTALHPPTEEFHQQKPFKFPPYSHSHSHSFDPSMNESATSSLTFRDKIAREGDGDDRSFSTFNSDPKNHRSPGRKEEIILYLKHPKQMHMESYMGKKDYYEQQIVNQQKQEENRPSSSSIFTPIEQDFHIQKQPIHKSFLSLNPQTREPITEPLLTSKYQNVIEFDFIISDLPCMQSFDINIELSSDLTQDLFSYHKSFFKMYPPLKTTITSASLDYYNNNKGVEDEGNGLIPLTGRSSRSGKLQNQSKKTSFMSVVTENASPDGEIGGEEENAELSTPFTARSHKPESQQIKKKISFMTAGTDQGSTKLESRTDEQIPLTGRTSISEKLLSKSKKSSFMTVATNKRSSKSGFREETEVEEKEEDDDENEVIQDFQNIFCETKDHFVYYLSPSLVDTPGIHVNIPTPVQTLPIFPSTIKDLSLSVLYYSSFLHIQQKEEKQKRSRSPSRPVSAAIIHEEMKGDLSLPLFHLSNNSSESKQVLDSYSNHPKNILNKHWPYQIWYDIGPKYYCIQQFSCLLSLIFEEFISDSLENISYEIQRQFVIIHHAFPDSSQRKKAADIVDLIYEGEWIALENKPSYFVQKQPLSHQTATHPLNIDQGKSLQLIDYFNSDYFEVEKNSVLSVASFISEKMTDIIVNQSNNPKEESENIRLHGLLNTSLSFGFLYKIRVKNSFGTSKWSETDYSKAFLSLGNIFISEEDLLKKGKIFIPNLKVPKTSQSDKKERNKKTAAMEKGTNPFEYIHEQKKKNHAIIEQLVNSIQLQSLTHPAEHALLISSRPMSSTSPVREQTRGVVRSPARKERGTEGHHLLKSSSGTFVSSSSPVSKSGSPHHQEKNRKSDRSRSRSPATVDRKSDKRKDLEKERKESESDNPHLQWLKSLQTTSPMVVSSNAPPR
jgi:hypothetical protein